jgi:SAM-dependent methyltransferase
LESLGISETEKTELLQLTRTGTTIDPVVAYLVAATNGLMYRHLIGVLERYPIPELPLPDGKDRRLLDVGCSWGRWSLAAASQGYEAVGIDPSLGAVMAARRVARQIGAPTRYVVGDARHLPFPAGVFDVIYSYSVIQHFSYTDAEQAAAEMGRVLRAGGIAKVQMPTKYGIRCLYHQARRGFRSPRRFEVRYRTLGQLRELFETRIGATRFEADCYFGIGLQRSDAALMNGPRTAVIAASEAVKSASHLIPALIRVADSVFANATKA